jgi:hypothetical protein
VKRRQTNTQGVPEQLQKVPVVYCIREGDSSNQKIGKTCDLVGRIRDLQCGNPRPLRLEGAVIHCLLKGAVGHETDIHQRYGRPKEGGWDWHLSESPIIQGVTSCTDNYFNYCNHCDVFTPGVPQRKQREVRAFFNKKRWKAVQ